MEEAREGGWRQGMGLGFQRMSLSKRCGRLEKGPMTFQTAIGCVMPSENSRIYLVFITLPDK